MKRILAGLALLMTLLAPMAQADIANLTNDERAILREEVRAYLLENPELIIEVINILEQRQQQQQAASDDALVANNINDLVNDGASWVGGNPDGDVTLVEFMDYRCGYCRKAFSEVEELVNSDGNIRLVVKEFPILGEQSVLSSRLAIATHLVAGDAAYEKMHDRLMVFNGPINAQSVRALTGDLGFGDQAEAIMAEMDSDAVNARIDDVHALAQRMKINGTPAFVLGPQLLRGYLPLDSMRQLLGQVRASN